MTVKRLVIYPSDLEIILGRSPRYCRKLYVIMKKHFNKTKHQFITIREFCEFAKIEHEDVVGRMLF